MEAHSGLPQTLVSKLSIVDVCVGPDNASCSRTKLLFGVPQESALRVTGKKRLTYFFSD